MVDSEPDVIKELQNVEALIEKKKKEIEKIVNGHTLLKGEKISAQQRIEAHDTIHDLCTKYEHMIRDSYLKVYNRYREILKNYADLNWRIEGENEQECIKKASENWQRYKEFARFIQGLFCILSETNISEIRKVGFEKIPIELYFETIPSPALYGIIERFLKLVLDSSIGDSKMKCLVGMFLELRSKYQDIKEFDPKTWQGKIEENLINELKEHKESILNEWLSLKNFQEKLENYENRLTKIFSGNPDVSKLGEEMASAVRNSIGSAVFSNGDMKILCMRVFESNDPNLWENLYAIFMRNPERLKKMSYYFKQYAIKELHDRFNKLFGEFKGRSFTELSHESKIDVFSQTIESWRSWSNLIKERFKDSEKEFNLELKGAFEEVFEEIIYKQMTEEQQKDQNSSANANNIAEYVNYQLHLLLLDSSLIKSGEDETKKDCLNILQVLPNIDYFLALYFLSMLRRLLNHTSAGYSKEKGMVYSLAEKFGSSIVSNIIKTLEEVLSISEDNAKFKQFCKKDPKISKNLVKLPLYVNNFSKENLDFIKNEAEVAIPSEIQDLQSLYEVYYNKYYPGRTLEWVYSFSTILVSQKGHGREILLHFYQYLILNQFDRNDNNTLTIRRIMIETGLDLPTISNCLIPMVFATDSQKCLLVKTPKSHKFSESDEIKFNKNFNPGSNYYEIEPPTPNLNSVGQLAQKGQRNRAWEVKLAILRILKKERDSGGKSLEWILVNYKNEFSSYQPSERFIHEQLDDLSKKGLLFYISGLYTYHNE